MLVLSRKQGQSIVIDERTVVTILQVGQGRIQIGIAAPPGVPVYRQEIHDRIVAERQLVSANTAVATSHRPGPLSEHLAETRLETRIIAEFTTA